VTDTLTVLRMRPYVKRRKVSDSVLHDSLLERCQAMNETEAKKCPKCGGDLEEGLLDATLGVSGRALY
jgi:ribosomal protein L40E